MIFPIYAQAHTLFQLTLPPPPFLPYKDLTKCPRGNEINDSYHLYLVAEESHSKFLEKSFNKLSAFPVLNGPHG